MKAKPATDQLTLFDTCLYERSYSNYDIEDGYDEVDYWPPPPVTESSWPPDIASDAVTESTDVACDAVTESITEDDSVTASMVNPAKYRAGGTARGGGEYWRYSCKWYGKTKHVHIPGGCCTSAIASSRAREVREAIATGKSVAEVLELIRSFTKKHQ